MTCCRTDSHSAAYHVVTMLHGEYRFPVQSTHSDRYCISCVDPLLQYRCLPNRRLSCTIDVVVSAIRATVAATTLTRPIRCLEVATPIAPPLFRPRLRALTWRSHGHSVATGCLYCDVVSARQCSYPVSALSGRDDVTAR